MHVSKKLLIHVIEDINCLIDHKIGKIKLVSTEGKVKTVFKDHAGDFSQNFLVNELVSHADLYEILSAYRGALLDIKYKLATFKGEGGTK